MVFNYSDASTENIKQALSSDRLATYLAACGDNTLSAMDLYLWNVGACGRLYGPLHAVEVCLRNAFHSKLSEICETADWPACDKFADISRKAPDSNLLGQIAKVRARLVKRGKDPITTPDIVAALEFGFWTRLVGSRFAPDLWAPGLHKAFKNFRTLTGKTLTRSEIAKKLNWANMLRNRVYHYEPLINTDLVRAYADLLQICDWIIEDFSGWIDHHSTLMDHVQSRDRPRHRL